MRELAAVTIALAMLTIGLGTPAAGADDTDDVPFELYLDAAREDGIVAEERTIETFVPGDQALEVRIDFTTFEIEANPVPTIQYDAHDKNDADCLVLSPGEEAGLTPGDGPHVHAADEQPEDVQGCQDDDAMHETGTDSMRFVTAGDEGAMFRLQRDFSAGWGWVWIECETGDAGVNFAIGPYDDLQHLECYVNNYGDPTEWTAYEAFVENDNTAGATYGSINYVS